MADERENDMDRWDYRLPETPDEVVILLRRRIEVHSRWRDFSRGGSTEAVACEQHGVGTAESHQRYINQYNAAIRVIESI